MEEEVKSKKNKTVLVVGIIVVILLIVGGYFILTKVDNKKEDKPSTENKDSNSNSNENKDEQGEALDLNSELVSTLLDYISIHSDKFYQKSSLSIADLSDGEKYEMAFKELDKEGILISCDIAAMNEISQSNDSKIEDCFVFKYEIPEQNLDKAMKKVLGEKVILSKSATPIEFHFSTKWDFKDLTLQKGLSSFQEEKFESFIGSDIYYDASKKSFIGTYETQGGGWIDDGIWTSKESAFKNGKIVTIIEKVSFIGPDSDISEDKVGIFSDYNRSKRIAVISNNDYEAISNGDKRLETFISDYDNKAMTVVYTFEQNEDGSYHFVSSKMTN